MLTRHRSLLVRRRDMWRHTISVTGRNTVAHDELATHWRKGEQKEAIAEHNTVEAMQRVWRSGFDPGWNLRAKPRTLAGRAPAIFKSLSRSRQMP